VYWADRDQDCGQRMWQWSLCVPRKNYWIAEQLSAFRGRLRSTDLILHELFCKLPGSNNSKMFDLLASYRSTVTLPLRAPAIWTTHNTRMLSYNLPPLKDDPANYNTKYAARYLQSLLTSPVIRSPSLLSPSSFKTNRLWSWRINFLLNRTSTSIRRWNYSPANAYLRTAASYPLH